METKNTSTGKIALIYGVILGLISIAFSVMLYVMDLAYQRNWAASAVSIVMICALIFIGIYQFRSANEGYLSLPEALKVGIGVALIGSIFSIVYLWVLTTYIEPGFWDKTFELARIEMQENYVNLSSDKIDEIITTQKNYLWLTYPTILIFNIFIGFVMALIIGLILKKSRDTEL